MFSLHSFYISICPLTPYLQNSQFGDQNSKTDNSFLNYKNFLPMNIELRVDKDYSVKLIFKCYNCSKRMTLVSRVIIVFHRKGTQFVLAIPVF